MTRNVIKFGGSNLKSKEDINKLITVIQKYETSPVIVISALYGVTNRLIEALKRIGESEAEVENLQGFLLESHFNIVDNYIDDKVYSDAIKTLIAERIKVLSKYLLGMHYLGDVPDFAYDVTMSYGERLSSLLLQSILRFKGIDCEEKLPEDIGLITNGEFANATIDFDKCQEKVRKNLADETLMIIPGFYGISEDGKVTLLGRGGTDYSAAAVARCIGADAVDVWKDVSGYMSADPGIVKNPVRLENLTYKEAAELSYFGAKILHPRTFEPLMDDGIPIRIFNINEIPEQLEPLTTIGSEPEISEKVVKSVTYNDNVAILKMRGPGVGIKPGIIASTASKLNDAKINIKSIITAQTTINILLEKDDLETSLEIVKSIELSFVDEVLGVENVALIAVVGEGMLHKHGIAAKVFTAVSNENINVSIIAAGASSVATYFLVEQKDREPAINAIHREFFK